MFYNHSQHVSYGQQDLDIGDCHNFTLLRKTIMQVPEVNILQTKVI